MKIKEIQGKYNTLEAGSEINFFGYSPVGRVAIKLYSPDTKITRPTGTVSKQQDK